MPPYTSGTAGSDTLYGSSGDDLIFGQGGHDTIYGGDGRDELQGNGGNDTIFGGDGHDRIFGDSYSDSEDDGNDIVYCGNGGDLVNGGQGDDRLEGEAGDDNLIGDAGDDMLFGGDGADVLGGNAGNDFIAGGNGDDSLYGSEGNDQLRGDSGHDVLNGVGGFDIALYDQSWNSVSVDLTAGYAYADGTGWTDELLSIEDVLGSVFNDTIVGSSVQNFLYGHGGNDVLSGMAGDDVLFGDQVLQNGVLYEYPGLSGNDILRGGAGHDLLFGGGGLDTADYSQAAAGVDVDLVTQYAYTDGDGSQDELYDIENITGSNFADLLTGNALANVLIGGGGDDILGARAGDDTLRGGAGADQLFGEDGDDILQGGAGVDVLNGGVGVDTADYSLATSGVTARLDAQSASNDGDGGTDSFVSIESLTGSAFNDLLIGGANGDVMKGGLGSDTLLGQGGNDVLWGGAGAANTLQGGLGDDWYVLEANDSVVEMAGEGLDTVEARVSAYTLGANVENLIYTGSGAFAATGNAGDNVITGGAGADNLRGLGGVDVLNGGGGIDTVDYTLAASGVTARLDVNVATNDGDGGTDSFTGVENLTGSNYNDLLIGDGNANVLMGGIGTDTLLGFGGDDILMGGSGGGNNQLQGGTGDDRYILDAYDTCVEFANEGIDTVEARIGVVVLGANIENLIYTGAGTGTFTGTGNSLDNMITGGGGNDILRGGGGNDTINGGLGNDEVQLRGVASEYTVTAEAGGWRVLDTVAGRDGSTFVLSVETLRFSNNATQVLTYPSAALSSADKGASNDAFVLPAQPDEPVTVADLVFADDLFAGRPLFGLEERSHGALFDVVQDLGLTSAHPHELWL